MTATPFMTDEEIAFLAAHLRPEDHVWEWGSGGSTLWLANRCKYVTTVEHQRAYADDVLVTAPSNVSLLFIPPSLPYVEGTEDDGDLETFRRYVSVYSGEGVDAVLVDGRARVACAQWIAERAPFGPDPELRVFVHDCQRAQLEPIWKDNPETGHVAKWVETGRAGNLMLLAAKFE